MSQNERDTLIASVKKSTEETEALETESALILARLECVQARIDVAYELAKYKYDQSLSLLSDLVCTARAGEYKPSADIETLVENIKRETRVMISNELLQKRRPETPPNVSVTVPVSQMPSRPRRRTTPSPLPPMAPSPQSFDSDELSDMSTEFGSDIESDNMALDTTLDMALDNEGGLALRMAMENEGGLDTRAFVRLFNNNNTGSRVSGRVRPPPGFYGS